MLQAALSALELWTRIDCLSLPPPFTATILSRSKTMPLSLAIDGPGLSPESLSNWLYAPVLRRTRELSIADMSISEFGACVRLLSSATPALEALTLSLPMTVRLSADLDARLAESSYPCLRRLVVKGLALNWSWPMFTSNLTHLSLMAHTREMMLSAIALEPQLLPVISTMSRLQELRLIDVLPAAPAPSAQYELPRSLRILVSVSSTANLSAGHVPLLERSRCVHSTVKVGNEDESVLTPIIRELFKIWDSDNYPAVELILVSQHAVVFYAEARPRHLWRLRADTAIESVNQIASSRRHLYVAEPDRISFNLGRGWKIFSYLHLVPMHALQIISISSSIAILNFPNPQAWISAFGAASNVRRLIISYRRAVNPLLALATQGAEGDEIAHFALFPRLETLVLHDGLATQKDDIALMDFLHFRECRGAKLQELMVEENLLALTSIWDSAKEATSVTYFKACTMEQALS